MYQHEALTLLQVSRRVKGSCLGDVFTVANLCIFIHVCLPSRLNSVLPYKISNQSRGRGQAPNTPCHHGNCSGRPFSLFSRMEWALRAWGLWIDSSVDAFLFCCLAAVNLMFFFYMTESNKLSSSWLTAQHQSTFSTNKHCVFCKKTPQTHLYSFLCFNLAHLTTCLLPLDHIKCKKSE